MNDQINRQDTIDALCVRFRDKWWNGPRVLKVIELLPSAEPSWIPVSERLPEDDTEVIVSCTDDSGDSEFSYTATGWYFKGMWVVGNERSCFVRAWMPLPKPYEEPTLHRYAIDSDLSKYIHLTEGGEEKMIKMLQETQEQLKEDLQRIMRYANQDEELEQMCARCEEWCGKEHDYSECLYKPCFTFYRAFKYLDFANGWHEGEQ